MSSPHVGWAYIRQEVGRLRGVRVVGEARAAEAGIALAARHRPDLVLLDVAIPGRSTVRVIAELLQNDPALRIVVLTESLDPKLVQQIGRLGTVSWLVWNAVGASDLGACLEAAAEGYCVLGTGAVQLLLERRDVTAGRAPTELSELEELVLDGLLNDLREIELAEREGWGERTVQEAVERLKEKYDVHTLPGLGAKAREESYGARE